MIRHSRSNRRPSSAISPLQHYGAQALVYTAGTLRRYPLLKILIVIFMLALVASLGSDFLLMSDRETKTTAACSIRWVYVWHSRLA